MNVNQGSATIYQFPVGGRAALRGHRDTAKPVTDLSSIRVSEAAVGESWYHAAAIQESKRTGEH
jgi:hypothetical protein